MDILDDYAALVPNKVEQYASELFTMIEERTGRQCESWIVPQVRAAAGTMALIDKVLKELMDDDLLIEAEGSRKQSKKIVNPLLSYYDKLQRTHLLQLEALGLNYKTTPSKVTESTVRNDEGDPFMKALRNAKEEIDDIPDE